MAIYTPADALELAKQHLEANERTLRATDRPDDWTVKVAARAAQVEALSAWAAAHTR